MYFCQPLLASVRLGEFSSGRCEIWILRPLRQTKTDREVSEIKFFDLEVNGCTSATLLPSPLVARHFTFYGAAARIAGLLPHGLEGKKEAFGIAAAEASAEFPK